MDPTLDPHKTGTPFDIHTSPGGISTYSPQQLEKPDIEVPEPTAGHTLGRLLHEFLYIAFFMGLHWVIKWGLTKTNQENEGWAAYLLYVSILYALVAFTIIFGAELVVDCVRAVKFAVRQIRKN